MHEGRESYWWSNDPRENIYMEITQRTDIGDDLKAPSVARGGAATPGYALLRAVGPGDIILHYDGRREAVVGASRVSGHAEDARLLWVARGTSARLAREKPRSLSGTRVPLDHFTPVDPPLTLADIRQQEDPILQVRGAIEARAGSRPLYFPWVRYRNGPIRTFQSYLVKMPRSVVELFPSLSRVVETLASEPDWSFSPLRDQLDPGVAEIAGCTTTSAPGQGYQVDHAVRMAVEAHAMKTAIAYYSKNWEVEDVHLRDSVDLVCHQGDLTKYVEVKGTTREGYYILLTPNEVAHAQAHASSALFVLAKITVTVETNGSVDATGGIPLIFDPWDIRSGQLEPIGYRYALPQGSQPDHGDASAACDQLAGYSVDE